jgi:hypothetical protein
MNIAAQFGHFFPKSLRSRRKMLMMSRYRIMAAMM